MYPLPILGERGWSSRDEKGTLCDPTGSDHFDLKYDAENRLVKVHTGDPNNPLAQFTYDGDGNRVKSVQNNVTTVFVGGYYEYEMVGSAVTTRRYYYAGSQWVTLRENSTLYWLSIIQ